MPKKKNYKGFSWNFCKSSELTDAAKKDPKHVESCTACKREAKKQKRKNFFRFWKKKETAPEKCTDCKHQEQAQRNIKQEVDQLDREVDGLLRIYCGNEKLSPTPSEMSWDLRLATQGINLPTNNITKPSCPRIDRSPEKEQVTLGAHSYVLIKQKPSNNIFGVPATSNWKEITHAELECQLELAKREVEICPQAPLITAGISYVNVVDDSSSETDLLEPVSESSYGLPGLFEPPQGKMAQIERTLKSRLTPEFEKLLKEDEIEELTSFVSWADSEAELTRLQNIVNFWGQPDPSSSDSGFEERFVFHDPEDFPPPEPFGGKPKIYPSQLAGVKMKVVGKLLGIAWPSFRKSVRKIDKNLWKMRAVTAQSKPAAKPKITKPPLPSPKPQKYNRIVKKLVKDINSRNIEENPDLDLKNKVKRAPVIRQVSQGAQTLILFDSGAMKRSKYEAGRNKSVVGSSKDSTTSGGRQPSSVDTHTSLCGSEPSLDQTEPSLSHQIPNHETMAQSSFDHRPVMPVIEPSPALEELGDAKPSVESLKDIADRAESDKCQEKKADPELAMNPGISLEGMKETKPSFESTKDENNKAEQNKSQDENAVTYFVAPTRELFANSTIGAQTFRLGAGLFQASTRYIHRKLRGMDKQEPVKVEETKSEEKALSESSDRTRTPTVASSTEMGAAACCSTVPSNVDNLISLGFTRTEAVQALKVMDNDVERAADWLFSGSNIDAPGAVLMERPTVSRERYARSPPLRPIDLVPKNIQEMYNKKKVSPITQQEYEQGIAEALLEMEPDTTPVTSSSTVASASKIYANVLGEVNSVGAFYSDYDIENTIGKTSTFTDTPKKDYTQAGNIARRGNEDRTRTETVEEEPEENSQPYRGITCAMM